MITFYPNCTLPTGHPSGFVTGPNIRSTLSIVWSCIGVILLSSLSVLHLNVPPPLETRKSRTIWPWLRKMTYPVKIKLPWMALMLAAPEIVVGRAAANLLAAKQNYDHLPVQNPQPEEGVTHARGLAQQAKDDEVPWSLTHTILANMGGIAIHFPNPAEPRSAEAMDTTSVHRYKFRCLCFTARRPEDNIELSAIPRPVETATRSGAELIRQNQADRQFVSSHSRHEALADEVSGSRQYRGSSRMRGNIWILDSKQLALARVHGVINSLPDIPLAEIHDKDKANITIRMLAIAQVIWVAIQLIERLHQGIPSTQLEIATVAYAACALILYVIEFYKPMDLLVPFIVDASACTTEEAFRSIAAAAPKPILGWRAEHRSCYTTTNGSMHQTGKPISFVYLAMDCALIAVATMFGCIHLVAWNYDFPTDIEQLLWRIATVASTLTPTLWVLLILFQTSLKEKQLVRKPMSIIMWSLVAPVYLVSRLFIMVEIFRSLYYLHPQAFISTWTANAPHIA